MAGAAYTAPVEQVQQTEGPVNVTEEKVIELHRRYAVDKDGFTINADSKEKDSRVMDGYVTIKEITRDHITGNTTYHLEGYDVTGRKITLSVPQDVFFDSNKLRIEIQSRFDIRCRIHLGKTDRMHKIIMDTTDIERLVELTEVTQPMWLGDKLIVPSLEPKGYRCTVNSTKLPYNMPSSCDIDIALEALGYILPAWPLKNSLPVMTLCLGSPVIAKLYPEFRYGYALIGVTGTKKTTFARLALSIYGAGFTDTMTMVKLGDGATANAGRDIFTEVGVMPGLMDNYKPYDKFSVSDLARLIHSVMEGGDKDRLNKDSKLRDPRKFYTSPIITGESFGLDPASAARVMPINWVGSNDVKLDTATYDMRVQLPAIGREWLLWLQTPNGLAAMKEFKEAFTAKRSEKARNLKMMGAINPDRLGSNFALAELTYGLICQHPSIGPVFERFWSEFNKGIQSLQKELATMTRESFEAEKLVDCIKELIARGKLLIKRDPLSTDRFGVERIGWTDEKFDCVYPRMCMKAFSDNRNEKAQTIDMSTIGQQLVARGYIIPDKEGNPTSPAHRPGTLNESIRVWRFKKGILV